MALLREQRCRHHPAREAAARCPACGGFFCRECVTEHEGRILCAGCLARLARTPDEKPRRRFHPLRALAGLLGLAALWLVFYAGGRLLLALPSSVHEGTVWESTAWWEK